MSIFLTKWHLRKWSVDERTFEALEGRKLENREAQISSYSYLPFSSPYDYYRKRKKKVVIARALARSNQSPFEDCFTPFAMTFTYQLIYDGYYNLFVFQWFCG